MVVGLSRGRQRLLRRIASRKGREAERVVLLEGPRVLETALECGAEILFVAHDESRSGILSPQVTGRLDETGAEMIGIASGELAEFSDTERSQGILAVAREPDETELPWLDPEAAVSPSGTLVLDGVRDPGNAGTLIRVAAAFGVPRVIAIDGTVDLWNAKVVRASAGLIFRTAVQRLAWEEVEAWLRGGGGSLVVGDPRGTNVQEWLRLGEMSSACPSWALLMGNETTGPRPEALEAAHARVSIPMESGVDSLSVATAGAILLWALGPGRALERKNSP